MFANNLSREMIRLVQDMEEKDAMSTDPELSRQKTVCFIVVWFGHPSHVNLSFRESRILQFLCMAARAVDPHSFFADPDPAFFSECGSGSRSRR